MRSVHCVLLLLALSIGSCSKWNVADKEITPGGGTSNPGTQPTVGAVTLNLAKPTALGNTSAIISFKVANPQGSTEYGVVLTPDPNQVAAVIAGTAAPLRRSVTGAFPSGGSVDFEITGLTENSPYYAVPYIKNASGNATYCNAAVGFRTRFGAINANWQQLASFITQRAYSYNPLFTINGKVYVGGADQPSSTSSYYYLKQLYEYDPQTNIWTKKKDFPGAGRLETNVAVFNNKAYIMFGIGVDGTGYTSDAWEYDPAADSWRQMAAPPAQGIYSQPAGGIPFVYNNKISVLFGRGSVNNNTGQTALYTSMYTLDPIANSWAVTFPMAEKSYGNDIIYGAARSGAFSFQYDKWVYFGGGLSASSYNATAGNPPYSSYFNSRKIWAYNMETKEVKQIATLPSGFNDCADANATGGRMSGFAFVVGSKAYITDCSDTQVFVIDLAAGINSGSYSIQTTNLRASTGASRQGTTGVGIGVGSKAYFGLRNADWYEFTP